MTPTTEPRTSRPTGGWRTRDLLRVAAVAVAVYATVRFAWTASSILIVTFFGLLFGLALAAGADRLRRLGVPRAVGVGAIVITFFALLVGLGRLVAPIVVEQGRELRTQLPEAVAQVERWLERQRGDVRELLEGDGAGGGQAQGRQPTPRTPPGETVRAQIVQQGERILGSFFTIFSSTAAVLGGLFLALFVAIYYALEPELYQRGLLHLFPHRARAQVADVLQKVGVMLRRWLVTQFVAMALVGGLTTVVLVLLDVRAAVALGVIAGLLEFVPIVGPILSAVPAIAMGLLDGLQTAVYVAIAYVAIQQIESQLLVPLLMKEGMDLPPILTLLAQAFMSVIFGFLGLLVAVPLLGAVMVPIKILYVRNVVGDEVSLPGEPEHAESG